MATKARTARYLIGTLVGALSLGALYFAAAPGRVGGRAAAGPGASPPAAAPADLERTMARLRERANAVAAQRERQAPAPSDGDFGFPAATLTLAKEVFDEMWAVRGLVHTHEQRTSAARRLLESPRALELVYHTSIDPDFARKAFGEQQAEARYFSQVVLEEAAKGGQRELLEHAVKVVRRGLASADAFDPGRGEDFRGLLAAYAGTMAPAELTAEAVQGLGYERGLSKEVRQIYYETVFSAVWKREGIEVAEARFREIFPEG
jgi:hypothetical protein